MADKYDLKRDIRFSTVVKSIDWDEAEGAWQIEFGTGELLTATYVLTAVGLLSVPTTPRIPGLSEFQGTAIHTFHWSEEIEWQDKRVAVIGTGSTGVQVIQTIAPDVAQLTVLQLDASWCIPLHNSEIDASEMDRIRSTYEEIFEACSQSPSGFLHRPDRRRLKEVSEQERIQFWENLYSEPGFGLWLANFRDVLLDEDANRELSDFVAVKIRQRVKDPSLAEILIPKDHGFGTKRVPLETGYYETYNRDNVELIDLNVSTILRIAPDGIVIDVEGHERIIEVDLIVFATGFDAVTGAFDRMDIRGVDGQSLREKWSNGPETFLGIASAGFPNFLTVAGPQSGSVASNFPRGIEEAVGYATRLIQHGVKLGHARFEASRDAELEWVEHVEEFHKMLLMSRTNSWFNGYNPNLDREVPTRPLIYSGGLVRYRDALLEEESQGFPNFHFSKQAVADQDAGTS